MLSGKLLRVPFATIAVCLCVLVGCSRRSETVIPLDVNSEVGWIVADDSGAWIALTTRASYELGKSLPSNYCFLRRYDRNGVVAKEVALGEGLFRRFDVGEDGALALVVEDSMQVAPGSASLSVDLWLAGRDGFEWRNVGRLPCSAVGAARLAPQAILVWDERRVYLSKDEGHNWAELFVRSGDAGRGAISREHVVIEGEHGGLLMALETYGAGALATTELGLLNCDDSYRRVAELQGRVAGMAKLDDDSVLLAVHEEHAETPGVAVYHLRDPRLTESSLECVHREDQVLPKALAMDRHEAVILGSRWRIPSSFLAAFSVRCFDVARVRDGTWKVGARSYLEREEPRKVAFSPDGSAWLYRSTLGKHEVVRLGPAR
jgi:hypothetical protein